MSGNSPSPDRSSPYATYLEHLERGELAYQFSPAADKAVFFPRVLCPYTGSEQLEWRISKGLGTVYSASTVHPRAGDPYNVSLVDCDEGFRLMTRVEGIAADRVAIGMRVSFRVHRPPAQEGREADDCYPVFVPANDDPERI
jgi:hypothetical protein